MKKKLSLLLACVLCLGLMPCAYADNNPFNDVAPGFWAYDAIMETYNDGVMTGTGGGAFSPAGKLNMGQFTTILARAFYADEITTSPDDTLWWEPAYRIAYYSNHNLFGEVHNIAGNTEVTREVMAEMMYRVMVDKNVVLPNDTEIQATINKIPDIAAVDGNYRTAVAVCYYWDLLAGVDAQGTFAPKGVLNRAQTAVIYTRLKKAVSVLGTGTPENPGTTPPDATTPNTAQNPSAATLTNGQPVTVDNVLALIEDYKNGTRDPGEKAKAAGFTSYAKTKPCQHYDPYNPPYYIAGLGSGTECAKFAFAFWDDLFGDLPFRKVTDIMDARPGDLIKSPGHWSIFRGIEFREVLGEECYSTISVDGGATGAVQWDDYYDAFGQVSWLLDSIQNGDVVIYTRYPE